MSQNIEGKSGMEGRAVQADPTLLPALQGKYILSSPYPASVLSSYLSAYAGTNGAGAVCHGAGVVGAVCRKGQAGWASEPIKHFSQTAEKPARHGGKPTV